MDTIGNRLNGLLAEHDLSQRDLSAEINVAHSTISRIISGNVIPSGRVLIELADYFCVSIDWLVGRENKRLQAERRRWIPCNERLPKNNDPVNVTWINHNPEVYYMDIKDKPFTATAHYHNGHWYWYSSVTQDNLNEYDVWTPDLVDKDVEITAWQPLPDPYKKSEVATE